MSFDRNALPTETATTIAEDIPNTGADFSAPQ